MIIAAIVLGVLFFTSFVVFFVLYMFQRLRTEMADNQMRDYLNDPDAHIVEEGDIEIEWHPETDTEDVHPSKDPDYSKIPVKHGNMNYFLPKYLAPFADDFLEQILGGATPNQAMKYILKLHENSE